jgi:hypothetical protein
MLLRANSLRSGLGVALLLLPLCIPASEAPAAGPAAQEQLELLDEVIVRSKRLALVIEEAEDDFFKLYNQVNKDDKYDVSCPRLNVSADSGSHINTRVCLPGFVSSAIADYAVFKVQCEPTFDNFDANRDGRITRPEAGMNADLDYQFDELDLDRSQSLSEFQEFEVFARWAQVNLNCYRPPPPELVLMEGSKGWYEHMMKVTNSDPRLRELAAGLDGLHYERAVVRGELAKFESKPGDRQVPRNTGPRPR